LRLGGDDGRTAVAGNPDVEVQRHLAEERDAQLLGFLARTAMAEDMRLVVLLDPEPLSPEQIADLRHANPADKRLTDTLRTDLTGANLRNADLSDARLETVTGLLAGNLAGSNLSNAKVPPDIA